MEPGSPQKQERNDSESGSGDSYSDDSSYSSSVETDLREEQAEAVSTNYQQHNENQDDEGPVLDEAALEDNPFLALQPAEQKPPRPPGAAPEDVIAAKKRLEQLVADGCPLKSLKARKKRKAQRQRRQEKRKEVLVSMDREQRIQFIHSERDRKKQELVHMKNKLVAGLTSNLRIVIDCEFEGKMSERENKSLISQLKFIYNRIKKSEKSFNITITGYGGKLEALVEYHNVKEWEFNWERKSLLQLIEEGVIPREKAVYLSPDASEEVSDITSDYVWIIGGLVDGTVIKDATKTKAEELGIKSKRLNVTQFKGNSSFRNCLNVNDVFNIVTGCLEGKPLEQTIFSNMPKRMKEAP